VLTVSNARLRLPRNHERGERRTPAEYQTRAAEEIGSPRSIFRTSETYGFGQLSAEEGIKREISIIRGWRLRSEA
jgi:hypothetical protein